MRVRALIAAAALLATLPAPAAAVDTYELDAAALDVVDDCLFVGFCKQRQLKRLRRLHGAQTRPGRCRLHPPGLDLFHRIFQ